MSLIKGICYNNSKIKALIHEVERLSYYVRMMREEDIPQVTDIDRESFPSEWPPVKYERELNNWLAHYIVACKESDELPPLGEEYIMGFAGFWMMADEAHVTSIAVRKIYRRQGIGELLLISIVGMARELNAYSFTLEVRTSNTAAQNLYSKYGFIQVGLRRGYYTEDKEDAVLMSTESISATSFQSRLNRLKKAHSQKWGVALYQVVL